jgi:hypothetical protein
MRIFTGVGLIRLKNWTRTFSGLIIGIPVFYRRRFMQGASAREALPPASRRFPPRFSSKFVVCDICDTGPSIPAASVCYPVEAGSLRSGIRSPHG